MLEIASHTIVWLIGECREWLGGRYVSCQWDVYELLAKRQEIVDGDKLKVKLIVQGRGGRKTQKKSIDSEECDEWVGEGKVATIVAASLIVSVAGCCIWSVKDREGVPANIAGNFSCEVVISVHGQDENTPPNSRIVTILCWINFGTIERTQFRPSRNRFRFHRGGQGAALTSPGPETYQDPPWVAASLSPCSRNLHLQYSFASEIQ